MMRLAALPRVAWQSGALGHVELLSWLRATRNIAHRWSDREDRYRVQTLRGGWVSIS
jgi:hypothetical protein